MVDIATIKFGCFMLSVRVRLSGGVNSNRKPVGDLS